MLEKARVSREKLDKAEASGRKASASEQAALMRSTAAELDTIADEVENATTLDKRQVVHDKLMNMLEKMADALAQQPTVNKSIQASMLSALVYPALQTQPTYSAEMRDALAEHGVGGKFNTQNPDPKFKGNPQQWNVVNITAPDSSKSFDGKQRNPAVEELIKEARYLFNHPYESDWWIPVIRTFMIEHADQIKTDIEARNTGVPTYFKPGENASGGHQH